MELRKRQRKVCGSEVWAETRCCLKPLILALECQGDFEDKGMCGGVVNNVDNGVWRGIPLCGGQAQSSFLYNSNPKLCCAQFVAAK
ncbi:unnamed protein product [Nippostrongylus brasiliensis]|uniref:Uncharacterized protein n=1 Tax=Nippostrongylus brasiliensis TaxID=27835 RepID=A0A0N4Y8E7_NIPBR|nr:unnamed protein product [Nippostrongylus brasiliensis]